MDSHSKAGKVYLQPHKAGKKWKAVWLTLVPHSSHGVGRLEIQDMGAGGSAGELGGGLKRHQQPPGDRKLKVVRLSELISVLRLPPNAEACPMENMAAFCVETQSRTMVFAALKDDSVEWVEKLCQSTFQRGAAASGFNHLHMEENQIYATADQATEFRVVVQRTDAAVRCGLQGSYWLEVGPKALLLKESTSVVREWPYELLRRYGRDKHALTIEAGRRCDSGPGTFTFETQQAEMLFNLIQSTIKRKTSENQEGERPKTPQLTHMESPSSKDSPHLQERSPSPAPITLMPLPMLPTHSGAAPRPPQHQPEAVYADPADCVPHPPSAKETTAQYMDPVKVLPLFPPTSRESPTSQPSVVVTAAVAGAAPSGLVLGRLDSVYAEVYDKLSPVSGGGGRSAESGAMARGPGPNEPIYDEPMSEGSGAGAPPASEEEPKPDPFAHLYAKVCKTKTPERPSPSCSPTPPSTAGGHSHPPPLQPDDIIYENLGVI